jgi:hypothetical protein
MTINGSWLDVAYEAFDLACHRYASPLELEWLCGQEYEVAES